MMMQNLETQFKNFEKKAKEIVSYNNETVFSTTLTKAIADFIDNIASRQFEHVYMTSVALLIGDVFDICFAKKAPNERKWNRFSNLDGYIGICCKESIQGATQVHILNGKIAMSRENRLTQKTLFIADAKMHAFFVAPMIIGDIIVGALQMSFFNEKSSTEIKEITKFLLWCTEKLSWILLAEQSKHKAVLNSADAIARTLDIKNEYQANHSKNVAKLAFHFLNEIVGNNDFMHILFDGAKSFHGFTSMRIKLAALLHDTGKLAMSTESFEEINNIEDYCKRHLHPYYTDMVLGSVSVTKSISKLAAFHHEKPQGIGYPYGIQIQEYMVEEQIIKLADMLDSMARERPHDIRQRRLFFDEIIEKLKDDRITRL